MDFWILVGAETVSPGGSVQGDEALIVWVVPSPRGLSVSRLAGIHGIQHGKLLALEARVLCGLCCQVKCRSPLMQKPQLVWLLPLVQEIPTPLTGQQQEIPCAPTRFPCLAQLTRALCSGLFLGISISEGMYSTNCSPAPSQPELAART